MDENEGYCICSAYSNKKVPLYNCVLEGNKYPCIYLLMPEKYWYSEINWRFKVADFYYRMKWRLWRR